MAHREERESSLESHRHRSAVANLASSSMAHPVAALLLSSLGPRYTTAGNFGQRFQLQSCQLVPAHCKPSGQASTERKNANDRSTTAHCKPSGQALPQVRLNPPTLRVPKTQVRRGRPQPKTKSPPRPAKPARVKLCSPRLLQTKPGCRGKSHTLCL